jgi:hypothetical protein
MTPGEVDTMLKELAAREAAKDRLDAAYRLNPKVDTAIGHTRALFRQPDQVEAYSLLKYGDRETFERYVREKAEWPVRASDKHKERLAKDAATRLRKLRTLLRNDMERQKLRSHPNVQRIELCEWALPIVDETIQRLRGNMESLGFAKKRGTAVPIEANDVPSPSSLGPDLVATDPAAVAEAIPPTSGRSVITPDDADAAVQEIIRQRGERGTDADGGVEHTHVIRDGRTRNTAPTARITQPLGEIEEVTEDDLRAAREAAHEAVARRNGRNPGLRDELEKIGALYGSGTRLDRFEAEDPQPGDRGHSEEQDKHAVEAARDERLGAAIDEVKRPKPWKGAVREAARGRWSDIVQGRQEAREKTGKTIRELQLEDAKGWVARKKEGISRKLGRKRGEVDTEAVIADAETPQPPSRDNEPVVSQRNAEGTPGQVDAREQPSEKITSDIERAEQVADDVAQEVQRSKENSVPQAIVESLRPRKGILSRFLSGEWGRQREIFDYETALKGDFGFMYEWSGKDDPKRIWAANNAINNQIGLTARRLSDSSIGRETLLHAAHENLEKLLARNDGSNIEWTPSDAEKSPPVFYV